MTEKPISPIIVTFKALPGVRAVPQWPEMESLADSSYAKNTPESWDADYRRIWQKLQVSERNNTILRSYARELRSIISGEEAAHLAGYRLAQEQAAQWLDFYDGKGLRRAEAIRALQPPAEWGTMIACDCGDYYPSDSDGGQFIDKIGQCRNCQAAEDAK